MEINSQSFLLSPSHCAYVCSFVFVILFSLCYVPSSLWRTPFTRLPLGNSDSAGATYGGDVNAVATLCPPFVYVKSSCLFSLSLFTHTGIVVLYCLQALNVDYSAHAHPPPTVANNQIQLSLTLALLTSTIAEYVNVQLKLKIALT